MTRGTAVMDFAEDLAMPVSDLSLELRVPVIVSPHPRWNYITAVEVRPPRDLRRCVVNRWWYWLIPPTRGPAGCVVSLFVLSGISALAAWLVLLNGSPT